MKAKVHSTVILRIVNGGLGLNEVVASIATQEGVRQLIVLSEGNSNPMPEDMLHQVHSQGIVLHSLTISEGIGERGFLSAAQLADYDPCVLWETSATMPNSLVQSLSHEFHDDVIVGILGHNITSLQRFSGTSLVMAEEGVVDVEYVELLGMMVHRRLLQLRYMPLRPPFQRHLAMWICAQRGVCKKVISLPGEHCSKFNRSPYDDEAELSYRLAHDSTTKSCRDWAEINERLARQAPERGFSNLGYPDRNHLLVLGCQRSGTTWIAERIGACHPDVFSFTEEQTFHMLFEGYTPPNLQAKHIIWHTTFINTEVESYRSAPARCKFLLMIREPSDVCWSLLHNFELLEHVHTYRRTHMHHEDLVEEVEGPLRMALELYRQSMRCGMELISQFRSRVLVVLYREALRAPQKVLGQIYDFIGVPQPADDILALAGSKRVPKRDRNLSADATHAVEQHCRKLFDLIIHTAEQQAKTISRDPSMEIS